MDMTGASDGPVSDGAAGGEGWQLEVPVRNEGLSGDCPGGRDDKNSDYETGGKFHGVLLLAGIALQVNSKPPNLAVKMPGYL